MYLRIFIHVENKFGTSLQHPRRMKLVRDHCAERIEGTACPYKFGHRESLYSFKKRLQSFAKIIFHAVNLSCSNRIGRFEPFKQARNTHFEALLPQYRITRGDDAFITSSPDIKYEGRGLTYIQRQPHSRCNKFGLTLTGDHLYLYPGFLFCSRHKFCPVLCRTNGRCSECNDLLRFQLIDDGAMGTKCIDAAIKCSRHDRSPSYTSLSQLNGYLGAEDRFEFPARHHIRHQQVKGICSKINDRDTHRSCEINLIKKAGKCSRLRVNSFRHQCGPSSSSFTVLCFIFFTKRSRLVLEPSIYW